MKYTELNSKVIEWGIDKGIFDKATPLTQLGKTQEEVNELFEGLVAQNNDLNTFTNSKGSIKFTDQEIKDAIGDIGVTLILQSQMQGLDFLECIESAYNIIKGRKGKMIDGTFVKDE